MKLTLTALLLICLAGCATPAPFQCSSTDPEICAVEKAQHELDQRMAAYNSCVFVHGPDPIMCQL